MIGDTNFRKFLKGVGDGKTTLTHSVVTSDRPEIYELDIRWKMISLRPGPGGVCASAKGLTLDERRRRDPDRIACPLRARHGYIPRFGEPETAGNPGVDARFLLRTWNRHTGLLSV